MSKTRLIELLDAWMLARARGEKVTAATLCVGCPELIPDLTRQIDAISRFERLAADETSENLCASIDTDVPSKSRTRHAKLPASIAGFKPISLLGEGGMGAVYLAKDEKLERQVALKVMKSDLAADSDARHRFLREARAMAAMDHENIMTIYSVGEDHGLPFLVMPVLKGETLDQRLRVAGRFSMSETCRIGREIASGLAAAHQSGLIHRDIKPSNIWLEGPERRVRILDFGLARSLGEDNGITQSGAILGTPAYMAPEQAAGSKASEKSDLFSLGAVLYHMVTGRQPFAGSNVMAILHNLANRRPKSPRQLVPEIPGHYSDLIDRLLKKSPGERPHSAMEVLSVLNNGELPESLPVINVIRGPAGQSSISNPTAVKRGRHFSSGSQQLPQGKPLRPVIRWLPAGAAGLLLLTVLLVNRKNLHTEPIQSTVARSAAEENMEPSRGTSSDGTATADASTAAASEPDTSETGPGQTDSLASSEHKSSTVDPKETSAEDVANAVIPVPSETHSPLSADLSGANSGAAKTKHRELPKQPPRFSGVTKVEGYQIRLVGADRLSELSVQSTPQMVYTAPVFFENSTVTSQNKPAKVGISGTGSFRFQQTRQQAKPNLGIAISVSEENDESTDNGKSAELDVGLEVILGDDESTRCPSVTDFSVQCPEFERRYPSAEYRYHEIPSSRTSAPIRAVRGSLLLIPRYREELRFVTSRRQTKRTRKGKRISIDVGRTDGNELQVSVEVPLSAAAGGNLTPGENETGEPTYLVQLEDDQGKRHAPTTVIKLDNNMTMLPFGGEMGFPKGLINSAAGAKDGNSVAKQTITCRFASLPDGTSQKAIVVLVTEPTGKARVVPFEIAVKAN